MNKVNITTTGDGLLADSAVIVCNHQSLADYFVVASLAKTLAAERTPQANFFAWYSLWRVPSIKTLLNMVRCDENFELSRAYCQRYFERVLVSESPEWVVLFPEVNILSPTASYLQKVHSDHYYLPFLDHTLYPRFAGIFNTLQMLRHPPHVKFSNLYDLTVTYDDPPSLLHFFGSPKPINATVHVRVFEIAKIPERRPKLEKWLEKTWVQKDKYIGTQLKERKVAQEEPSTLFFDRPISSFVHMESTHLA